MKKFLVCMVLICVAIYGSAQMDSDNVLSANYTAVIVSDMDRSVEWYKNILRFEIIDAVQLKERGVHITNMKRDETLLELIKFKDSIHPDSLLSEKTRKNKIIGFFKVGFSVGDFDAWMNYLISRKVNFSGDVVLDQNSGKRMVLVLDPDGNRIQFFEE